MLTKMSLFCSNCLFLRSTSAFKISLKFIISTLCLQRKKKSFKKKIENTIHVRTRNFIGWCYQCCPMKSINTKSTSVALLSRCPDINSFIRLSDQKEIMSVTMHVLVKFLQFISLLSQVSSFTIASLNLWNVMFNWDVRKYGIAEMVMS